MSGKVETSEVKKEVIYVYRLPYAVVKEYMKKNNYKSQKDYRERTGAKSEKKYYEKNREQILAKSKEKRRLAKEEEERLDRIERENRSFHYDFIRAMPGGI